MDYDSGDEETEVFIPTHEWQTIKPGQGIPKGLHVRINLETGQKEAKLLEEQDQSGKSAAENPLFNKRMVKELKEALRLIPNDISQDSEKESEARQFRSIDEIKEEFDKLKINITTENEIMLGLLKRYVKQDISDEEKIVLLTELEYYVHQYDNAVDFTKAGGMTLALSALNSTNEKVRTAAAFLLGSAMQSNPKVQVSAVENGVMQQLIHLLAIEPSTTLRLKVLYALSSLLRHFPYAQKKFLDLGGLSILTSFFGKDDADILKLQLKAVTLVHDLVLEHKQALAHSSVANKVEKERLKQYSLVKLKEAMEHHGWCRHIPRMLKISDHDLREKVLMAMQVLVDVCYKEFVKFIPDLEILQREYTQLASEEQEQDDKIYYFGDIYRMINELLTDIEIEALKIRDEL